MRLQASPGSLTYVAGEDDRLLRCTVGNEFTTGRETHALSKLNACTWFDGQRNSL